VCHLQGLGARHREERSDVAISWVGLRRWRLLRFARNDGAQVSSSAQRGRQTSLSMNPSRGKPECNQRSDWDGLLTR
jgi:hypothetical protein